LLPFAPDSSTNPFLPTTFISPLPWLLLLFLPLAPTFPPQYTHSPDSPDWNRNSTSLRGVWVGGLSPVSGHFADLGWKAKESDTNHFCWICRPQVILFGLLHIWQDPKYARSNCESLNLPKLTALS
jgi:hypothetical protein